jgi:phage terminase large subunit-like protein
MKWRTIVVPGDATWLPDYRSELELFPLSAFDDQVDATSQFINWGG